jgi:predicted metalloprotease with PDZ domain
MARCILPRVLVMFPALMVMLTGCGSGHQVAERRSPPPSPVEHQARPTPPPHAPAEPVPAPSGGGLAGVQVRFGIAPGNYADDQPGVLIGEVFDGTSAALAGLKPGDRMTRWNGKPIPDVEGWMPFLAAARPGDVVDLTFLRDGKELTAKVTLQAR